MNLSYFIVFIHLFTKWGQWKQAGNTRLHSPAARSLWLCVFDARGDSTHWKLLLETIKMKVLRRWKQWTCGPENQNNDLDRSLWRETAKSGLSLFISDVGIWSGRISLKVQHVTFGHMPFIPPTNRGQHITRVTVNWHRSPEKEGFGHS